MDTGEAAQPVEVIKSHMLYAGGAALLSLIFFYFFGGTAEGAGDRSVLMAMSNASGL